MCFEINLIIIKLKVFLFKLKYKFALLKFNITKIIYLKLLKLKKMANVKKRKVQTEEDFWNHCSVYFVGWLI
jgi:hypothetical protein